MLRISKLADYATVLMSYLSQTNAALNAAKIAEETQIPQPTVRKLLKTLQNAKLLISTRGSAGGYQLTCPAQTIYLGQIIEAVDGPLALTECCTATRNCSQEHNCHTKDHWQVINKVVRNALYTVNLTTLAKKQPSEILLPFPRQKPRGDYERN